MRLRERKQVNYDVDDSEEEECRTVRREFVDAVIEPSDSDASDETPAADEEDNWGSDEEYKDSQGSPSHGKQARSLLDKEDGGDERDGDSDDDEEEDDDWPADLHVQHHRHRGGFQSRNMMSTDRSLLASLSLKPRSTRARVNYNEDSCSEGSGKEAKTKHTGERYDSQPSDMSFPQPDSRSGDDKGQKGEDLNGSFISSDLAIKDDIGMEDDDVKEKESGSVGTGAKSHRRLIKLADRSKGLQKCGDTKHLHVSVKHQGDKERSDRPAELHGNARCLHGGTKARKNGKQRQGARSECNSDSLSEMQSNAKAISGTSNEIEFLAHVYVRRWRSPGGAAKTKPVPAVPAQAEEEPLLPELKVDVFGPYSGGDESRAVVKRVGLVEKILSVRNRGTDAAVYCVKLSGKGYRNAVYVRESLLARDYSQLLRHFLRRMDDLNRVDGNVGETADSPAFNPSYIQIDRILAAEQRGRKKFYLVKWQGLPYSESTWEAEDSLVGEKYALKRFLQLSTKGAPGSNTLAFKDGRVLRDYQKKGLAWMDHNYQNHVNCILADEMGLGKTIQSVSMLQNLRVKWKVKGPFLVVAPVSTLGHWQREIESLTDMNCLVYAGSMEDRNVMKDYEFYTSGKSSELKFNVLLTGYEVLMKDHYFLSKHEWQYIIVDEAHRLKTKQSKTSRTLKEMSVRKGGLLLLTGTPVQNNTKEIFSLLNILDPDQFKSEDDFLSKYGDIKNAEQVRDLQENILKPRLLRRMKEDVEKSIPLKEETIIWVELTKDQRSYYRAIYENRISDLLKGSQNSNIPNLRNVAMELRKLCNHPFLCDGLEEHLTSKSIQNGQEREQRDEGSCKALCLNSGKMMLLDKLLPMLKDAGRRVLIFSQFTMMLDLLEDYLHSKDYSYERIDGKIRGSERQAAIDRYSARGSETFVFLLSTRAGGLGITLTAADTCVIYDSDWNPQNDLQAMARCHRIGQTKDVKIYRLITRNTYEQHLFECSSRKYGLDEAILGNILGSSVDIEHTKNIETLLKRGAYDILKDDGEAEAAAFHAQNIDQILEQRTQQRLIGGRGNNTFSVATFISNPEIQSDEVDDKEKNTHTSMESAQFWQELLPEAYQATLYVEKPQEVTSTGPRRRAQVNYKEKREISDDEGSSDEEIKNDGRKRHTANKRNKDVDVEDGLKHWSEKDLKRLENRLIMLGKGREEQAMVEAELEHRGLLEVQQVADTLIQLFHYFEEKERNTVSGKEAESRSKEQDTSAKVEGVSNADCQVQDVKAVADVPYSQYTQDPAWPKIPPFAQKALSSQYCMLRIQKNASRYLQTLHERDVLSKALSDVKFSLVSVPRSKKLPLWWGDVEDLHLMRGALKHGQKEFLKIREDPSLCFFARLNVKKHNEVALAEQNLTCATELCQSAEAKDHLQEDGWPHDSVLTMRLKKIVEYLPNGLSDREIKRRAAVAEAARKRWLAKQGQESSVAPFQDSESIQRGFIVYIDGCRYEQPEFKPNNKAGGDMDCNMPVMGSISTSLQGNAHQMQRPEVSQAWKAGPIQVDSTGSCSDPRQLPTSGGSSVALVREPSALPHTDVGSKANHDLLGSALQRCASRGKADQACMGVSRMQWTPDGVSLESDMQVLGSAKRMAGSLAPDFSKKQRVEMSKQEV